MISIWLFALAEIGLPLAAGFAIGGLQRSERARWPLLLLSLALAAGSFAVVTTLRVGVWDGALIALVFFAVAAGRISGLFKGRSRELQLGCAGAVASLVMVELAARVFFPHPPGVAPPEAAHLLVPQVDLVRPAPAHGDNVFTPRHLVDACAYLYPDHYPDHWRDRIDRVGHRVAPSAAVLHLGDSMTMGLGLSIEQAFPAVLEKAHPEVAQINGSMASMSVDYYYVIAQHWLERPPWPIKAVVLNLFYNDPMEIDQGMPCCDDRSLLTYTDGKVAERCPEPSWVEGYGRSLGWFARYSAPPYPLRLATSFSFVARYLDAWLVNMVPFTAPGIDGPHDSWGHLEAVVRALRDDLATRRIPMIAVIMPVRMVLESQQPEKLEADAICRRMSEICRGLGVTTYDAADALRERVKRDGSARYFLGRDDIHLTAEGHAVVAEWLDPKLAPYMR